VSLLDTVMIDYYGTPTPLNQIASVHAPEPQMLTVQPRDPTYLGSVEKAVARPTWANPSNDEAGADSISPLTEGANNSPNRFWNYPRNTTRCAASVAMKRQAKKLLKDKVSLRITRLRQFVFLIRSPTPTKIDELSAIKEHEIMTSNVRQTSVCRYH
jgi:ribosome recycling factor